MLKKILSYLVATIIWLTVLEWGSRFVIDQYGDPLLKSYRILQQDARLGWKLKPNLDLHFYDGKLTTNKYGFRASRDITQNQFVSVMTMGPSSAFGWGVGDKETYTHFISQWINEQQMNATEPFNASQVGYSSLQGEWLFEELKSWNLRPRVVVVAYGVNDIDRYRFYFSSAKSDRQELTDPKDVRTFNLLSRSSFFNLVSYVAKKNMGHLRCEWMAKVPVRRLSLDESMNAYLSILSYHKEAEVPVVIINTPHRYESRFHNFDIDAEIKIQQIKQKSFSSREAFIENIKNVIEDHPYQTLGYYELMRAAAEEKDCESAQDYFEKARANEPRRIVFEINRFNKALARLASEKDVPMVDAHRLLGEEKEMFVDPIHPSVEGHKVIAESVIRRLSSIKGD